MTGTTIDRYEVGEKLGAGGMGEVYRALDTRLRRPVALKFLPDALSRDPEARARFLREAQAASALDHPNIENIHEIREHEGRLFIVMALYEGETLQDRMERGAPSFDECETILRQLLEAAAAAHQAGIVHRDLKPANIMLTHARRSASGGEGPLHLKVVDFGLAKLGGEGQESRTRLTRQGVMMGTAAYMSPEQSRGDPLDARTDLWSIGVIAYEMLTGRHPFRAASFVGTLTRIATEEPAPLDRPGAEVPEHLRLLVDQLMCKEPGQRIASAELALELLGDDSSALATARSRAIALASAGRGDRRKRWMPLAGAGVLGIALTLFALWALRVPGDAGPDAASFVVLPCQVFGAEEFLTDAVPSTLFALLAQVPGLDTRRPPTSQEINPAVAELERLARTFDVRNCVTCSVVGTGDDLLINFQLVDPETSRPLWSQDYEGSQDTFIDVIRRSARDLRDFFLPGTPEEVSTAAVAANSEAELEFQRGKYHSERYNNERLPQDLELATASFERALELDSGLADAAGEIAILQLWSLGIDGAEQVRKSVAAALEIDDTCSRAWTARAFLEWAELDHERALESALQAMRFGPNDGLAHWPLYTLLKVYSNDLALAAVNRSTVGDRLYAWGYIGQASALFQQGRIDDALERIDRALEIDFGHYAGNSYRSMFLATAGRTDEARRAFSEMTKAVDRTPEYLQQYAAFAVDLASAAPGQRGEILESFGRERCTRFECLDEAYRFLTPLLLRAGAVDLVVTILDDYRRTGKQPAYDWLMLTPGLEGLRKHERFPEIAENARTQHEQFRDLLQAARLRSDLPSFLERDLADLERRLMSVP